MPESIKVEKLHQLTGHNASVFCVNDFFEDASFLSGAGDGWVVKWDLRDPEVGRLVAKVETQIFSLKYIKDSNIVVVGNMNGGVHWVNLADPEKTKNIAHHRKGVFDIIQYDQWILTAGGAGLLSRWDIAQKRAVDSLHLTNRSLRCMDYCPRRNEIAVGASDNAIHLLEAETLQIRSKWPQAHDNSVFTVKYNQDGTLLFSGGRDAMLKVWDLEKQTCLNDQPAHWFTINDLALSPSGRYLASASRDKTIKIWDAHSFKLLKVLDTVRDGGHLNSVNRLYWSSFNNTLVSCSDDRSIILWNMDVNGL